MDCSQSDEFIKKRDRACCQNYQDINLNTAHQMYSTIINNRLQVLTCHYCKQFGFRKLYSHIDNVFIIKKIIKNVENLTEKLHYKKAFDCAWLETLL